jgi:hypothetical protein
LSFEAERQEAEQEKRERKEERERERERVRKEWRKREKADFTAEKRSRISLKFYLGRCSMIKSW